MLKKIIVLVLAVAGAAAAYNFNDWLSLNGTNSAVYMRQEEDGQRWTWDILQTELWAWRFAVGAEAEFNHPRRPVVEPVDRVYPEGDELIQRYGRYRDDIFDVRVGDFDKTLGKGLILRSYADRDFEIYHRLDGGVADVNVSFADRDWGSVTALWGKNNRDEELYEEGGDTVAGGQITFRPFDFVYVSGAGVQADIEYVSYPTNETVEEKLYSGGLGGGWRYFDVYAEYATREGYDPNLQEDVNGSGLYGVVTGYLPRSSVSVEYKRYDDLSYGYSNPPPCSVRESAIVGPDSPGGTEWGYYVQGTANPVNDVRLRGGYSYADNAVGDVEERTELIREYFGEVRYDLPWPVVLEAGYEYAEDPYYLGLEEPTGGEARRIPSLGVSTTPWDDHSFAAEFERESVTEYAPSASEDYTYNRGSLGYTYSSWLGLTVSYEDTDKTEQELIAWGDPPKLPDLYRSKNKWLWGEVRLSWYNPTFQNHTLTIGYGSQRGGLVCSSGVCQQQAPFNGLKVALESSF